jgi:hypothetical protein
VIGAVPGASASHERGAVMTGPGAAVCVLGAVSTEDHRTAGPRADGSPRRPGARRIWRRPRRYATAKSPEELRRHQPHHPSLRQEENCRRPVRAQRPAHRRPHGPGPSPPSTPAPEHAPATTTSAPAAPATRPPSASSPNRLTRILHGCLKTRTLYDEATAWPQTAQPKSCGWSCCRRRSRSVLTSAISCSGLPSVITRRTA